MVAGIATASGQEQSPSERRTVNGERPQLSRNATAAVRNPVPSASRSETGKSFQTAKDAPLLNCSVDLGFFFHSPQ